MRGFGCYVRNQPWKEFFFFFLKRDKQRQERRETPKQQRNKYSVESANCNVSPMRQRLLLLTGETGNTCVQSNDHWPTDGKNNPHPCAQITSLIWVYLTVRERERERGVEFISCQVMILCDQVSKAGRFDFTVYKQAGKLSALGDCCQILPKPNRFVVLMTCSWQLGIQISLASKWENIELIFPCPSNLYV